MNAAGRDPAIACVQELKLSGRLVAALCGALNEDEGGWKPAPDRFSPAEVVAHLAHAEEHCYGERLRRWYDSAPSLQSYNTDALVAAGAYSGQSLRAALAEFESLRSRNLEWLRSMPEDVRGRIAQHARVGRVALSELVAEWACHTLGHLQQLSELVRAVKCKPHLGPFQDDYPLSP